MESMEVPYLLLQLLQYLPGGAAATYLQRNARATHTTVTVAGEEEWRVTTLRMGKGFVRQA